MELEEVSLSTNALNHVAVRLPLCSHEAQSIHGKSARLPQCPEESFLVNGWLEPHLSSVEYCHQAPDVLPCLNSEYGPVVFRMRTSACPGTISSLSSPTTS